MSNINKIEVEKISYDIEDTIARETKVDKVSGKGLSTNDFTNAEKSKLASITPEKYIDIQELENETTARINGDNLLSLNKQDKLVSGTNIKTVNNQTLLGSGNIDITSGSSDHSTLTKLDYASSGHTGFAGTEIQNTFNSTQKINANSYSGINLEDANDTNTYAHLGNYGISAKDGTTNKQFKYTDIATTSDLSTKQNTLTAGANITIENDVISATGQVSTSWGTITGNLSSQTDLQTVLNAKANTSSLSTVATTGAYSDLSGKPSIPTKTSDLQNDSDFVAESDLALVATTGLYSDLSGKPTLATVATTGNYQDLRNRPTNMSNFFYDIIDYIYPVGSIYMSATLSTPALVGAALGGTWQAWGAGRVPVGVDTTQSEFDYVEETGGEKTHTLTIDEMPQHRHNDEHSYIPNGSSTVWGIGVINNGGSIETTTLTGGNAAHNNLQPYITCFMYKRIS